MQRFAMRAALILVLALFGCGRSVTPTPVPPPPPTPPPPYVIPQFILDGFPSGVKALYYNDRYYHIHNGELAKYDVRLIPERYERAEARIAALRGPVKDQLPWTVFSIRPNEIRMPSGNGGFAVNDLVYASDLQNLQRTWPGSFVDGRFYVRGVTIPPANNPRPGMDLVNVVYLLDECPECIEHESLHLVWFSNWPDETCPGEQVRKVYSETEHGGSCDPFRVK